MKLLQIVMAAFFFVAISSYRPPDQKVKFKSDPRNKKLEVYIGGKFFTAFIYPDNMEKQTLYPIMTASGKTITRGYPMEPRPFERTDHPHHVGLWFNFGDVNGLDFWNNSFAVKAEDKPKYGNIRFRKILSARNGKLVTQSDWVDHAGNLLVEETSSFYFLETAGVRMIRRETSLKAAQKVVFTENKEGLLGLRVDRAFEEPATKPEKFLDANGIETLVPVMNNEGVNGVYRNASGNKGGEVWGKRSPWVALRAKKSDEIITIVILDHPKNPNYPAWSHARGYGLFATNNLGGRHFDPKAGEVKIELQPQQTLEFKHEVIIGGDLSDEQINTFAQSFK